MSENASETILSTPSSMIRYIQNGDLLKSNAHVLVNAVNCRGVMGAGIALAFKNKYPEMFTDYQTKCRQKKIKIGTLHLYKVSEELWILNFPTKDDYKKPSQLEYIEKGLLYLVGNAKKLNIRSIAFPALGCGCGGLDWTAVYPMMSKHLNKLQIPIEVHSAFPEPNLSLAPEIDNKRKTARSDFFKPRKRKVAQQAELDSQQSLGNS